MKYGLNKNIEKNLNERNLTFSIAKIYDIDEILALYYERIQWFQDRGIEQWNDYLDYHSKAEFIDNIDQENYFVLKDNNNKIIAGFELSSDSKYWQDQITEAYYIYKLVIKVGYKNMANLIFNICRDIALLNNKVMLRLDCLKNNNKLNKIYESHKFKLIRNGQDDDYIYSLREWIFDK